MKKSILNLFVSTFLSLVLFSCSSSKNDPQDSLVTDKTSVKMIGASSSIFNITANGDWTINVPKTNWLTVAPTSGSGNAAVTCTAILPNTYREKRQTNLSIFPTSGSSAVVAVKDSLINAAPAAPASAVYPANGATGVNESAINLRWTPAVDPDGDRVYYNLQTSADGTTWTTIATNLPVPFYTSGTTLTANTKYYWRVQAVDLFGALSSYSAAFSYTTATNASAWADGEVRLYQNCINSTATDPFTLIVTGDGFTASDMAAGGNWNTWSNRAIQGLLGNIEPYKTWGNYLRIIRIANVSQESGISQHVLTGDTDGKCSVVVNTKFGTYYDNTSSSAFCGLYDNSSTSSTGGSATKAFQIVNDELTAAGYNITKNFAVLILMNVSHYNGTVSYYFDSQSPLGKTLGCVCLSPGQINSQTGFENVVCHEIGGHAIGHLADLYISSTGTLSQDKATQTQQYQSVGWYQNVSLTSDKTQCPWKSFFTNTADHDTYYPAVDIYAGARSVASGIWRPQSGPTCMNDNRFEYDAPSRYSIANQLKVCAGESPLTWSEFVNKDYDRNNTNVTKAFNAVPNAPRLPEPTIHFIHK